jgi:hypothetical protein
METILQTMLMGRAVDAGADTNDSELRAEILGLTRNAVRDLDRNE